MSRMSAGILALSAAVFLNDAVWAQAYPVKPVHLVVPYAAGGPVDIVGRYVAQKLTEKWRHQVIVENRGGSGGALGANAVAKAPPDGYMLLLGNGGPITVYPHLRKSLLYSPDSDFAPAALLIVSCMVLMAHPSLPAKSVAELVRLAKKSPGVLTYSSSGVGGLQHLGMELLQSVAGIKMVHVPYKGAAPALLDVLSGQIDLQFNNVVGALPHVKAGKVRGLAVSTAKRSSVLPDVPPVASVYPGFDVASWMGIFAPAGISKELLAAVTRDAVWAMNQPETRQRMADLGAEVVAGGPAELAAYTRNESALFGKIIAAAGIPKE